MRRSAVLALVLAAFGAAGVREARAAAIPFTASLEMALANLALPSVTGQGLAQVNGSTGGAHVASLALPAGAVATTGLTMAVTDPAAAPIQGVLFTAANGVGAFARTAGGDLHGTMPLAGVIRICLFAACSAAPPGNLSVPLSVVGVGGSQAIAFAVNLTVSGMPWTTATASLGSITTMGHAHGPASGASSTAQASGTLGLVTPILIQTNIGVGVTVPFFARFTLHFVPEPATALLLGGGVALLGVWGAGRRPGWG